MDYNSNTMGHLVDSLPSYPAKPSLDTIGSRKPLSCSQAEALDNILTDGPYPLSGVSKCGESGYFSTESKLSVLHTTNENLANEIGKFVISIQLNKTLLLITKLCTYWYFEH